MKIAASTVPADIVALTGWEARTVATPTVSSVLKAFEIIELLARERALTSQECGSALGYPTSSVYRLLVTLKQAGIVETDDGGRFRLGLHMFELGSAVPQRRWLADRARRPMEELCDRTGLQSHLAVLCDGALVYVESVHGRNASIPVRIGQRGVVHAAGVGKMLLAHASEEIIDSVANGSLERHTANTITDAEKLRSELAEIRRTGVSRDREELVLGLSCIALPIATLDGRVVAAISLSGKPSSIEPNLRQLRDDLSRTVRAIERGLGWQPGLDEYLTRRLGLAESASNGDRAELVSQNESYA